MSDSMNGSVGVKKSEDLLRDILAIRGIGEVFLVGRDGFVIEYMVEEGDTTDMDAVGASFAGTIAKLLELDFHLRSGGFRELYVEYGNKLVICVPVGDLFVAVVATELSGLASIRFKLKKQLPEAIDFG